MAIGRIADPNERWGRARSGSVAGGVVVYPPRVSAKLPQTYILHTFVLFIVIAIAMVVFLRHQWG